MKMKAIICDLDGTLSLNTSGRSYYDASECDRDTVNVPVGDLLDLIQGQDYLAVTIIYLSGREDKYKEPTLRFLEENGFYDDCNAYAELYMRKTGDNRSDDIIKWEIYKEHIEPLYEVMFALDDRDRVVNMWRSNGISCFQVAPGDF